MWNQNAAMFGLYTVSKIVVRYMPYIAQIGEENKNLALTRMVPTYSIQEHETAGPVNPNDYLAHGPTVWKVV